MEILTLRMEAWEIINYTYLIVSANGGAALVDPAWDMDQIDRVICEKKLGLQTVFLTHAHYDHINLAEAICQKYNAHFYLSKREKSYSGFDCPNLHLFDDGNRIRLGDSFMTCYLTPGHTPGSSSFLIRNNFFTGDTLFSEGCGNCLYPGGCPSQMFDSLNKIKSIVNPDTVIRPGHAFGIQPGQTYAQVLKSNIYLNIDDRDTFMAFRMKNNYVKRKFI